MSANTLIALSVGAMFALSFVILVLSYLERRPRPIPPPTPPPPPPPSEKVTEQVNPGLAANEAFERMQASLPRPPSHSE